MRKQTLQRSAVFILALAAALTARSQSAYFEAVTNLNPAVYLPMQEQVLAPQNDVETNLGSLGAAGNAVYPSINAQKQNPGVTGDGDYCVSFDGSGGGYLAVPLNGATNAVLPLGPFTVEAWVYPATYGREGIVSQSGPIGSGGLTGSANAAGSAGWALTENDLPVANTTTVGWAFHVYNGNGSVGSTAGAEASIVTPYQLNQWYHIVGVFDGVNCQLYIDATNFNSFGTSTNTVTFQYPMTGTQAQDTWDPLTIGCARGLNNNLFNGRIDEVAIYTNALTPTQIQNHYNAASGGTYYNTVINDKPYIYWRMDAPAFTAPAQSTYPAAANYGWLPVTTAGGSMGSTYGPASLPGLAGPQFAGMEDPNNDNLSLAVNFNGVGGDNGGNASVNIGNNLSIAAATPLDVGIDSQGVLNITNMTNFSYSCSIWFKANPADNRFQNLFGHSDNGWRTAVDTAGKVHFKGGNIGTEITSARVYNDGNWHQLVATMTKTTENLYIDGVLDTTAVGATNFNGCAQDVIVGGDPMYLNTGSTAYSLQDGNGVNPNATNFNSGTAPGRVFSGSLAHFAFFTNVLTAAQIQTLYTAAGVPPAILAQPLSGRVNPASAYLFFGVVASGASTLNYQWYFTPTTNYSSGVLLANGTKYASATTAQVTVSNLVDSDSGYYYVVITNNYGSVTSALASVFINDEPNITAQSPSNSYSLYPKQSQIFSVTATTGETNAAPFLWYQWYTNGVADPTGTNSTYTAAPAQAAVVGTVYQCVVTNLYGSATNLPVSLVSLLTAPVIPAAITNSSYGSNVMALNPTAYWPMHEVEQPLVQRDMETNYGTLGQIANAYYGDWQINNGAPSNTAVVHLSPSPLAGDSDPSAEFTGGAGSYAVIPRTAPGTTIKAPFTLEAWVKPINNSFGIILGCGNLTTNHGPNNVDAFGGFDWLWAGSANTFSITMRSGPTNTGAATTAAATTEPKTTASYYPGQWYHLVTTYDGTNITYYIDGQQVGLQNSSAATLAPDTWQPLTIGGGRWTGAINNQFQGYIDELAVYTNLLSPTIIQQHFNDGTSPTGNYKQDVLTNYPILYYRMDSMPYTNPPQSTWPALTNYGSVAVQGVYRPNAAPGGVPGPGASSGLPDAGFAANTALQGDGNSVWADAGFDPLFNPTGHTPFTVSAWMKANPSDDSDRNWQSMVGHSDSGWRLNINGGDGRANFNAGPGGGSDLGNNTATTQVNDGNWHYMVGTYDGTNSSIYVDGKLSITVSNGTAITGTTLDVFLGSYPNDTNYNASRQFAGNMCEAALWNGTALTSNQIATLYLAAEIPPTIGTQPTSGTANQNGSYTNKVAASAGNAPFSYQWYENGLPVSGQTNATLILSPVTVAEASSNWFAVVSNPYGSVTSSVVSLTVFSVPTITQQPTLTNLVLFAGGHATFSVAASGAVPLYYYWFSNSVPILGATNSSFTLTNAESAGQTNNYYCLVSNAPGTTASLPVTVAVITPPTDPYATNVMAANPVGYWRLNEPEVGGGDDGQVAYDYWGGNNGTYTNVTLGQPGYNANATNETSCEFGVNSFVNGDVYGIPNISFAAPTNSSTNFTIEAWAKGYQQTADAGVVTLGYGGGGEQFILDCGSDTTNAANPVAHSFRFFVRDSAGTTHIVVSDVNPNDSNWHHLVGVCNESSGYVAFYIDGLLAGTNTITPGAGILSSTRSMLIGARPSNSTTNVNDSQFVGWVADVAVYNYALSSNQIVAQYYGADIPAQVITQPTNTLADQGGTATFSAGVEGTPVVAMQWYDVNAGSQPIAGQTNATLVLNNVQSNDSYYLVVMNAFGTNTSQTANLTVATGMPAITADVPPEVFVMENDTATIPVTVQGSLPISYQWQYNGANLADNGVYTGSQSSNVLTIAGAQPANAGSYQLIATNIYGAVTSSVSTVVVGTLPLSFNNGLGWQGEQTGGYTTTEMTNGLLTLTDGAGSEARSFFFDYPQYIGAFKASYTYQDVGGGGADGVAFVLQNDPRGASALGGAGGSLGVSGITPSCELEFNVYAGSADGLGYNIFTNGATGTNLKLGNGSATVEGTNELGSGDPINVSVSYANSTLTLTFVDTVDSYTFTTNINVGNLQTLLGGPTAYVGFTGADGGTTSTQVITNFTFASIPTEAIQIGNSSVMITWPSLVTGYSLLQSTNLVNWTTVTNTPTVINSQYEVVMPAGSGNMFYQLILSAPSE